MLSVSFRPRSSMLSQRFGLWCLFCFLGTSPLLSKNLSSPIAFPQEVDFGVAKMGEQIKIISVGMNMEQGPITIEAIKPSCGCTTVQFDPNIAISPGANIVLPIIMDTNQKMGPIRKSIKVYVKGNPLPASFFVTGTIIENKKEHHSNAKSHIFSQACASCHAHQGVGLYGLSLYLANCACCHGTNRQGGSACPLPPSPPQNAWLKTLQEGRNGMPAFSHMRQGPLSDDQLTSLDQLLKTRTTSPFTNLKNVHGAQVYRAACSPCHGEMRLGPIGTDISAHKLSHLSHRDLEKILAEGTNSPLMPSFLK